MSQTTTTISRKRDGLTVRERAEQLFANGYRIRLGGVIGAVVISPERREYSVSPQDRMCTCPAFSMRALTPLCKHIRGVFKLAIDQADAMCWRAAEMDMQATLGMDGCAYTAEGMRLRARAVAMYDKAQRLRFWAEDTREAMIAAEVRQDYSPPVEDPACKACGRIDYVQRADGTWGCVCETEGRI